MCQVAYLWLFTELLREADIPGRRHADKTGSVALHVGVGRGEQVADSMTRAPQGEIRQGFRGPKHKSLGR